MGLDLGEFEEAKRTGGVTCWWKTTEFSEEQRAKLAEVLDHRPDIKTASIHRVISSWDFQLSEGAVRHHRIRGCRCPKP